MTWEVAVNGTRVWSGGVPVSEDRMMVQVRLPRDLVRAVDHYAIEVDEYRAQAVERLLRAGLEAIGYRYQQPEAS